MPGERGENGLDTKMQTTVEFMEDLQFCVIDLAGLEVGTSKIGPVLETVATLCDVLCSHLPSTAASQRMIDEGHVLAKQYIRNVVINKSKSLGMYKDDMSKRKVKILDKAIQIDTGDNFCLGWSPIVSETWEAKASETKEKLGKLVETSDKGGRMEKVLYKFTYFMNDRAANEKKK